MKKKLIFLAKLLGISLLLYAAHKPLMMAYEFVLLAVIFFFPSSQLMAPGLYYDSSLWLIPTFILLLATPGLSWSRRSLMLLVGLGSYWALDFVSFLIWVTPPPPNVQASEAHYLYSLVWKMIGQWVLPFLLWIVAAYRQINDFIAEKVTSDQ